MALFVVDYVFDPARDPASTTARAVGDSAQSIMEFVGADGERAFAVHDAADAETVRNALGRDSPRAAEVWAAVKLAPAAAESLGDVFVVEERFEPPIDLSQAAPQNDQLSPCLQTYDVAWIASFIALDGTRCRCVYGAPDGDAVRRAYRTAAMPFVRVWSVAPSA